MHTKRNQSAVTQQAAEWTEVLKHGDAKDRAAFDEWLMESPRHVREFLLMTSLDHALGSVDPERKHDVQALLAQAPDDVFTLPSAPLAGGRRRGRWSFKPLRFAASLAAVALLPAGWYLTQPLRHQTYVTDIGEQRTLQLADGSIVYLNTRSRLQVDFSSRARDLRLLEGQALFKVQQDSARPFRVQAGEALIQAIGTQFDIYRRPDATTTVCVLEGRVRISNDENATNLAAGQAASVSAGGEVGKQTTADIAHATAWLQRRLKFRRDTLAEVTAEFNRYNRTPRFRLAGDEALAHRHYSGEFDADDPESLLQLLRTDLRLSVMKNRDEIVVRAR